MLVSYKWLKEYVHLNGISADALAEKITRSGIEVDGVKQISKGVKGVVVGYVLTCERHPNADTLNKCLVDIGEADPVQIICGAPNVATGQKVAVAKVGAVLPGNFKIKRAKLRAEESHGMICSLQELGVEAKLVPKDFADGIFVFPEDVEIGADAIALLNLDDEVLEFDLTPNRSDCLSMLGTAYEVAAILEQKVSLPKAKIAPSTENATNYISVQIEAQDANPLYVAKVIKNVKIKPSPLWLQGYLMAAGIRPHNNVVDITNYILLEYGQPLHAFDYDRFGSKEIVIRHANQNEKILTLDGAERTLSEDHLVITNGKAPVALAGVMGGAESEVQDDTTTVLLESAYFTGKTVRKASKDHHLRSEASTRFEKGVDPNRVRAAAERAASLMAKYANGEVLTGSVEQNYLDKQPAVISITIEKINSVLGTTIKMSEVEAIFQRLQFDVKKEENVLTVTVPTRRGDITIEEDLIEEVARIYGYDCLPTTLPTGATTPGHLTNEQRKRRITRRFMEGAGLYQALTYSLTSDEKAIAYALDDCIPVKIAMPMSEERSHLRLSLVPELLDSLSYNLARKNTHTALYEMGSVFLQHDKKEQVEEQEHLAMAMTGLWQSHDWQGEKKQVDFYVAKGLLEGLFAKLGVNESIHYRPAVIDGMHPGRTAEILLEDTVIGFVGQVHPNVQKRLDLKETYVFELKTRPIFAYPVSSLRYQAIPRYPAVSRDIALVVDRSVAAGTLKEIIQGAGGSLLKAVEVFDLYEGEHLEAGKKSIAFTLNYYNPEKTLTDEEVMTIHDKVLQAVKEKADAALRE